MTRTYRIPLFLLLGLIFFLALLTTLALDRLVGKDPLVNEPIHSAMEALGAMCSVVMAIFLLQGKSEQDIEGYSPLAPCFLALGIFDGFHAFSGQGNAFIFFHSFASIAGSLGAVLIWSSRFGIWVKRSHRRTWWTAAAGLVLMGVLILQYQHVLPAMLQEGAFTSAAMAINLLAGILFLITMVFFLVDFFHLHRKESYLFSCLYLLLGLAELEFPLSSAWSGNWWFWHLQRLGACMVVLYFLFHTFHRIAVERDSVIVKLQEALAEVKQLSGLLPICAACKKIRDDEGRWKQMEVFISQHSDAEFSHGLCPDCTSKAFADLDSLKKRTGNRQG